MDSTVPQSTQTYSVKYINMDDSNCNNMYQIVTTDQNKYKYAGNYIIKVLADGALIAKYNQYCSNLGFDKSGFLLQQSFYSKDIQAGETITFTISGTDIYGNKVQESLYEDIEIYFETEGIKTEIESTKNEDNPGELNYFVSVKKAGTHQLHITYKEKKLQMLMEEKIYLL